MPSATDLTRTRHAVAFGVDGSLYDGDDGGIFRLSEPTSIANQRWTSLNTNLQITQFTGIALDPTDPNVVYGGSQDNGTEKYTGMRAGIGSRLATAA